MDKAPAYGAGDCEFESRVGLNSFFFWCISLLVNVSFWVVTDAQHLCTPALEVLKISVIYFQRYILVFGAPEKNEIFFQRFNFLQPQRKKKTASVEPFIQINIII